MNEDAPSSSRAAQVLAAIERALVSSPPPGVQAAYVRGFFTRNRAQVLALLESRLGARVPLPKAPTTPAARTKANLAAMKLLTKAPGRITPGDVAVLSQYTGWGGLSIEKIREKVPAGVPIPEKRGLIHEYYTDSLITDDVVKVVRRLLPGLPVYKGDVLALEPSAGIGRFLRSAAGSPLEAGGLAGAGLPQVRWDAVEYSAVSGAILQRLYATEDAVSVHLGSFEAFVAQHLDRLRGRLGLVLSNPPYGPRGKSIVEDPDKSYREKAAYKYFLLRNLDLLARNGLGVFLVPAGFMTGPGNAKLRARVLKRHHLSAAFRLPSRIFPGALLVTDLLFFRARGGTLPTVLQEDRHIVEGGYFAANPAHVLGEEVGTDKGGDDTTRKPRWGYEILGDYPGLPLFDERPVCLTCPLELDPKPAQPSKKKPKRKATAASVGDKAGQAMVLGDRVADFLAEAARGSRRAVDLYAELAAALRAWSARHGSPHVDPGLASARKRKVGSIVSLLSAFERDGTLIAGLQSAPTRTVHYNGAADDVQAQAEYLHRTTRHVTPQSLLRFHKSEGGPLRTQQQIMTAMVDCATDDDASWGSWCWAVDPLHDDVRRNVLDVAFVPMAEYLTGDLWAKVDRLEVLADTQTAKRQRARLMAAIKPLVWEDLEDVSPRQGWIPLTVLHAWLDQGRGLGKLVRKDGILQLDDVEYGELRENESLYGLTREIRWFLGWCNHDRSTFNPRATSSESAKGITADDKRLEQAGKWDRAFRAWATENDEAKRQLEDAYNRAFRGFVAPPTDTTPRRLARWDYERINPHPHQHAGANRLGQNGGGLLAFDVGVGKTYAGLHALAAARQDGAAQRPVLLVPNSIVWKWAKDVETVLPDYSYVVIGSARKRATRGKRKGQLVSVTDSPQDRAAKWARFQAGEVDVALVTYSAFPRTNLRESTVEYFAETVQSIRKNVELRKQREKGKSGKKSERQEAVDEETTAGWLAERLVLPKGWEPDTGVFWEDLAVDFLMVDEAQNYKNLWMPDAREGGVPRFMGAGGNGSKRAWHMDIRCRTVRERTGGRGIYLLSATPAKNSPLEFYNLLQYVDGEVWSRMGIHDSEQFIDRYCALAMRPIVTGTGAIEYKSAVVGFKHLDELREVIFRLGEFRTAEEVGLVLPEPEVELIEVDLNAAQETKYASYVQAIEDALQAGDGTQTLGYLARMAMVSIHPELDEGWSWRSAGELEEVCSPKFDAVADAVLTSCSHGHIVFLDNVVGHKWLKTHLVARGVDPKRIAILNAKTAGAAERQRIAEHFNGAPEQGIEPKYDVLIANAVAYEGIDLQTRTCAIHHLDLPWEPATLQQRNGRGVRQGNTLGSIKIYYYFGRRSMDGLRFSLIQGKRGWMTALLTSQARSTNNPGAQSDMSQEDVLLLISRNPEETKEKLEAVKAKKAAQRRLRQAQATIKLLGSANGRFLRAATSKDATRAAQLRAEAEQLLADVLQTAPEVYPWVDVAERVVREHRLVLVPPETAEDPILPPLHEGLRFRAPRLGGNWDHFEVGKVGPIFAGLRDGSGGQWLQVELTTIQKKITSQLSVDDLSPSTWPGADGKPSVPFLRYNPKKLWLTLSWRHASDAWLSRQWPAVAADVATAMAGVASYYNDPAERLPVVEQGRLVLRSFGEAGRLGHLALLPPTEAGFQRLLELARSSPGGFTWTELKRAAALWFWGRNIPMGLLPKDDAP